MVSPANVCEYMGVSVHRTATSVRSIVPGGLNGMLPTVFGFRVRVAVGGFVRYVRERGFCQRHRLWYTIIETSLDFCGCHPHHCYHVPLQSAHLTYLTLRSVFYYAQITPE